MAEDIAHLLRRHHRLLLQVTHFTVNHVSLMGSYLEAPKTTMPNLTDHRTAPVGALRTRPAH